eukprot:533175-Hanusia_phi.AAC.1
MDIEPGVLPLWPTSGPVVISTVTWTPAPSDQAYRHVAASRSRRSREQEDGGRAAIQSLVGGHTARTR